MWLFSIVKLIFALGLALFRALLWIESLPRRYASGKQSLRDYAAGLLSVLD
jgi:hypothetical protein